MTFYIFASLLIGFFFGGIVCGGIAYHCGQQDEKLEQLNRAERCANEHENR